MFHDFRYPAILAASTRAAWQIDDVISPDAELDFKRPFLPESLARTAPLPMLSGKERLTLNHIRAHDYLCLFGLVEEFILPFVMDHIRAELPAADDHRIRAMLNFAAEEAKHIQLFKRFHETFTRDFGIDCEVIGPPEAVAKVVLAHEPLSVALFILMIEWMTQSHYVGSVRADANLDPLFANLLRCHWIEEAQHAKLDTLIVEVLAEGMSEEQIRSAVEGMITICSFMDTGLLQQSKFNLDALERATGRTFSDDERRALEDQQHQALRWTYIGSGLRHENFRATLGALSPDELKRIDALAPSFC
ncbi:diiron oxygenase [Sphingomonas sp. G124]|uniref:Diiron oxygenase n=1 Tax=Sphingomonas cremea TaxID=2904799 RepID=A0A9X1QKZ0_9SPHN|nr:diiron oxygenase [Sphingomonas cremea]MCF2514611.1 diiron oxygenase [Sphingomonas cremea]